MQPSDLPDDVKSLYIRLWTRYRTCELYISLPCRFCLGVELDDTNHACNHVVPGSSLHSCATYYPTP